MNNFDYQFTFDDIVDGYSTVKLTQYKQTTPIRFEASIDDSPISLLNGKCLSPLQADLLDLATAIHFADKFALPKKKRSLRICISLPLRHPEVFIQTGQMLQDLLFWYTKDHWHFRFQTRKTINRASEYLRERYLMLADFPEVVEFALWSGGLDSLAGLQTRLLESQNRQFVLIGTGSNNIMRKTQQKVFRHLHRLPHAADRLRLLHIPIKAKYGERYTQNQSHRARGIVFLLIGAVCVLANGYNKLHVYETGIGAINLPFPGGVGRDHSKAVHPISLIKMENFISNIVGNAFSIVNPFIFLTKAKMCSSLSDNPLPIFETISCDRLHREKYIQCGFCSSCILRRQALVAAGIEDQTKYLISHGRRSQPRHLLYWSLMNEQVNHIEKALNCSNPFPHLCEAYPNDLPEFVSHMAESNSYRENVLKDGLVELYGAYVQEWQDVGSSILENITHSRDYINHREDEKWYQLSLINWTHVN